jgi:hypothetical protein
VGEGIAPESDIAVFAILGYDPHEHHTAAIRPEDLDDAAEGPGPGRRFDKRRAGRRAHLPRPRSLQVADGSPDAGGPGGVRHGLEGAQGGVDGDPHEAERAAAALKAQLHEEGYWPTPLTHTSNPYIGPAPERVARGNFASTDVGDKWDTSPYRAEKPVMGISTGAYIRNMGVLIQYLISQQQD